MFADSTVLAYVLSELNRRHNYGLDLFLLSVDEGITGYRDDSLETVKRNEIQVSGSFFFFLINSCSFLFILCSLFPRKAGPVCFMYALLLCLL